jgi:hypothetical protein
MKVFHHVNAVLGDPRIKELEACNDVTHNVATIVQDNVWRSELSDYVLQELPVLLCPNADLDLVFFEFLALGKNVNPDDARVRAKISLSHLQGAAPAAADFDERHRLVNEVPKVAFVNGEIMLPLVDQPSIVS